FMDLTPYYVDLTRIPEGSDDDLARMARAVADRRRTVGECIQSMGLSAFLRPVDAQSKKPYVFVTLDSAHGEVGLDEFGPADLLDDARRAALREAFRPRPGREQLVYAVFPTVYSPATPHNRAQARNMGAHVHRTMKRLQPVDDDRVLDVGTGSGYLSWVAWATAHAIGRGLRMSAIDINPLAVANARVMARTAHFVLEGVVHDNVVTRAGRLAFPGEQFRLLIWDMPALPREIKPYLARRAAPETSRPLATYWDDGEGALESLDRFAAALPRILDRGVTTAGAAHGRRGPGAAVIWNIVPVDSGDVVQDTFRKAGLAPRLLDTYTSSGGAERCVVYAVSFR
ncbi:MAG TPA: hypothetical protein VJV75_07670, partial [Candidatus Polarisedimenticolia bacterium]|nr:hypothetical protein [Candidatus Polarisedimenticolia bacterium]